MKKIKVLVEVYVFAQDSVTEETAQNYVADSFAETLLEVPFPDDVALDMKKIERKVKAEGMVIGDYKVQDSLF